MTARAPLDAVGDDALDTLITIRDWTRVAMSRFQAAGLVYGHGTETALDEAAFLILHTLRLPIDQLEPFLDARLLRSERAAVLAIIEARIATRKPAPYLTNEAWIQGHSFYVDERVIVPRSYLGELLAEERIDGLVPDADAVTRVLDLCTGSGCLAILAALAFPRAQVDAVDISPDAVAVARRNVADYGLDQRVALHAGDLFGPLGDRRYHLIVSNPPYVDRQGMADLPPEYAHEPTLALAAGEDGLDIVRKILPVVARHLTADGVLVLEIGRCRPAFESSFLELQPTWLETAASRDQVLLLTAEGLRSLAGGQTSHAPRKRGNKTR